MTMENPGGIRGYEYSKFDKNFLRSFSELKEEFRNSQESEKDQIILEIKASLESGHITEKDIRQFYSELRDILSGEFLDEEMKKLTHAFPFLQDKK